MKMHNYSFILIATCMIAMSACHAPNQAARHTDVGYQIVDHLKIGGDSGWDALAVDSQRHHLFVTRGNEVQVVDTVSGKLVTTLTGLEGAHGVAVAEATGFISNGKSNSVTAFDLDSLQVIETITISGISPDAIIYEPTQKRVYTMNHKSGNITVLDAVTRQVTGNIEALGELEFAVLDGKGKLFVNSEEASEIAVINLQMSKMVAHWTLGNCQNPTGLAMDVAHERIFSACANNLMVVVDARSGKLIAQLPIGSKPDGAAFDPALGMAFSSNGDGTLTVIREDDPDHFRVVENLPTQMGARTMTIDPQTHRLYLSAALYGVMPLATVDVPKPRPPILPGTFNIVVVAPK